MADKEEKILVLHGTGEYLCNKLNDDIPCENKYNCLECKLGISRSEVIERMAKAAKKAYRGYFYTEPHHPNISDIMEAALNSLLEGK